MPLIQGYEDAGDFTFTERLKTSIHENLIFYLVVGSIGLFGIILLATLGKFGFVTNSFTENKYIFIIVTLMQKLLIFFRISLLRTHVCIILNFIKTCDWY